MHAATPLYVRLSAEPARRLEQAVAESGKSKRQIVEEAVQGLVVGRIDLREEAPEILTAAEAAALLRVAEPDLLTAAGKGEVPGRRIGEEWRFSRAALLDWLGATAARPAA